MIAPAPSRSQLWAGLLLVAAVLATALVFAPGQSGSFRFDDHTNLQPLVRLQDQPTATDLSQFLARGMSSPTGRPVSLATFAAQAHDWPDNPRSFLRVNLLIHLLNGVLLFWMWLRVCHLRGATAPALYAVPLLATGFWMVSPIQVTSVLYVVQRMTELSATFVFSGLVIYLAGRQAFVDGRHLRGLALSGLGLAWGAGAGTLAKENAALMPVLVLGLEATLLAGLARPGLWRLGVGAMVLLPIIGLIGYLGVSVFPAHPGFGMRDFGLAERLMTETRVLFMYLHKMLLPWPGAVRLLYDDYPTSASLWQPWTTLVSVMALAGCIAVALRHRLKWPLFSFGVFWFLGAHLLESTVLPLELVFEHRNYQAGAGVWFAIVAAIAGLWSRLPTRNGRAIIAGVCGVLLVLHALVTWRTAILWGQPFQMAMWQAQQQPRSHRAQVELIGMLEAFGFKAEAEDSALQAAARWPDDATFHLIRLRAACQDPGAPPVSLEETGERVRRTTAHVLSTIVHLGALIQEFERGDCAGVTTAQVRRLVEAGLENPRLMTQRQKMLLNHSTILGLDGDLVASADTLRKAVEIKPAMSLLLRGALVELRAGRLEQARRYLRQAQDDPRISPGDRLSHQEDADAVARLVDEVAASGSGEQ